MSLNMKKSIAAVGWFPIAFTEGTGYKYDTINWVEDDEAGGRDFTADPRGELTDVYANGKCVMSVNENDGYDIKLQLLSIVDDIEAEWLGKTVDAATHAVAEYSEGKKMPKFGLVVVYTSVEGGYIVEWYYQCQVTKRNSKSGKTTEGKFEAQFLDLELVCNPREHDDPKKRLVTYTEYLAEKPTKVNVPTEGTTAQASATE